MRSRARERRHTFSQHNDCSCWFFHSVASGSRLLRAGISFVVLLPRSVTQGLQRHLDSELHDAGTQLPSLVKSNDCRGQLKIGGWQSVVDIYRALFASKPETCTKLSGCSVRQARARLALAFLFTAMTTMMLTLRQLSWVTTRRLETWNIYHSPPFTAANIICTRNEASTLLSTPYLSD